MIKHITKIIWAERKTNIWIVLELILVFSILWFCSDYLAFMFKRSMEPNSFDIEHTYVVNFGQKPGFDEIDENQKIGNLWTIYDRIKQYSVIENAAFSSVAIPYSGSWYGAQYNVDTISEGVLQKWVAPEFFDIYKINIVSGTGFNENNSTNPKNIVISAGEDKLFAKQAIEQVKLVTANDMKDSLNVVGVATRTKRSEYQPYYAVAYMPIGRNSKDLLKRGIPDLSIRVSPSADKDFETQFLKEMQPQCEIGPYYLSSISSGSEIKKDFLKWNGFTNSFRNIAAITSFLILNIFLGVIGTFWFRIQTRRSEIGLRIAVGASKVNLKSMFVAETIMLLFIASIVGTIISINLGLTDLLNDLGLPIIRDQESGFVEYATNYSITFIALAIISVLAAWYPARRASKVYPAEALRDQ